MRSLILVLTVAIGGFAFAQGFLGIGGWWYFEDIDPVTDENFSYLTSIPLELYEGQEGANLQVACQSSAPHGLEVALFVERDVGGEPVPVDLRFDEAAAVVAGGWLPSNNGRSLLLPADEVPSFLERGVAATALAFDVHFGDAAQRFDFNIEATQRVLALLRCYQAP